jgi:hypothetical protein
MTTLQIKIEYANIKSATGRGNKVEAIKHERFAAALCLHESLTLPDIDPVWHQPTGLTLKGVFVCVGVYYCDGCTGS